MSKLKWAALFFVILSGLSYLPSCSPTPQKDCGFVQNIYGQRIAWKTKVAIPLHIHTSVPKEIRPAIYRAIKTWEGQVGRTVFQVIEDSTELGAAPSKDQKNGIYFLGDWESDRKSEQGRTSVYWAGDQIQEADIRINAADFSYYDQDAQILVGSANLKKQGLSPKEGYSFEALILHELGHMMGLKHREGGTTVMATHLAAYTNRVQLAQVDQDSIKCEYH